MFKCVADVIQLCCDAQAHYRNTAKVRLFGKMETQERTGKFLFFVFTFSLGVISICPLYRYVSDAKHALIYE